jgi:hypothetical protein
MSSSSLAERVSSPLLNHVEAQTRDLNWTLAHFMFVANVTTLAAECDIAHSPAMSVASCHAMPRQALAFIGESPDLLTTYATFLADPGCDVELLVDEAQRRVVRDAFAVLASTPKWQLVFRGDPATLSPGLATELVDNDLPAMQSLARAEDATLQMFSEDPFAHGPAFGVWEKRKLVAMATVNVRVPGAAQIANLVARPDHRAAQADVVSALVQALAAEGLVAFCIADQDATETLTFLEELGFVRERAMYLMHCVLRV